MGDLSMSDERSPHSKAQRINSTLDDITFSDASERLSPQLLEEFHDDESPSSEVLLLLEENARLRALTVELSNLLGNLPDREWGAASTLANAARSVRRKAGA